MQSNNNEYGSLLQTVRRATTERKPSQKQAFNFSEEIVDIVWKCRITTRAIATPTSAPPSPQAPARSGAKRAGRITVNGLRVTTPGAWEVMYRELKTNKARCPQYCLTAFLLSNRRQQHQYAQVTGYLRAQVIGIAPHEVKFALERNVAIVDVRVPREFATAHIPGAINVPIYHSITGKC